MRGPAPPALSPLVGVCLQEGRQASRPYPFLRELSIHVGCFSRVIGVVLPTIRGINPKGRPTKSARPPTHLFIESLDLLTPSMGVPLRLADTVASSHRWPLSVLVRGELGGRGNWKGMG